jgi:HAD superfamily hydrolase (TIGR01549 family)
MGIATFKPERIKVIFFDINETLLDPKGSFRQAFMEIWDGMSGRWETDTDRPDGEQLWQGYRAERTTRGTPGSRNESYSEMLRMDVKAMAAALEKWSVKLPDSALHQFFHKVAEQQDKTPLLYPGAAEALAQLSKLYKVAIISNGMPDRQTKRLRAADQLPPLREDRMFFSASIGVRKPHPAIFLHALDKMGYRPNQAVMVGNSWSKDVLGAIQVHMNAVWFRPGRKQKHFRRKVGSARIHIVQSMEQLLSLFEISAGVQQSSK